VGVLLESGFISDKGDSSSPIGLLRLDATSVSFGCVIKMIATTSVLLAHLRQKMVRVGASVPFRIRPHGERRNPRSRVQVAIVTW
jgi:hypothetical protein